jgi:hypothetical protein
MRSSKSRSRSKQNRPRPIGNIINRVFESSGPEGKVRGTPQQIIEKYLLLARDAQLSNDRVAAENFLQHAEHYTRMLGEAQRELAAEQDARRQQGGGQFQQGGGGHQEGRERFVHPGQRQRDFRDDDQPDIAPPPPVFMPQFGFDEEPDSGLVETPEARAVVMPAHADAAGGHRHPPRDRPAQAESDTEPAAPADNAQTSGRQGDRRPRGPRRAPRGDAGPGSAAAE